MGKRGPKPSEIKNFTPLKEEGLNYNQERFCREYVLSGGDILGSYQAIYDTKNNNVARLAAAKILEKQVSKDFIKALKNKRNRAEFSSVKKVLSKRNDVRNKLLEIIENSKNEGNIIKAADLFFRSTNNVQEFNGNEVTDDEVKNVFEINKLLLKDKEIDKNNVKYIGKTIEAEIKDK